jgi:hypothetical protein
MWREVVWVGVGSLQVLVLDLIGLTCYYQVCPILIWHSDFVCQQYQLDLHSGAPRYQCHLCLCLAPFESSLSCLECSGPLTPSSHVLFRSPSSWSIWNSFVATTLRASTGHCHRAAGTLVLSCLASYGHSNPMQCLRSSPMSLGQVLLHAVIPMSNGPSGSGIGVAVC